MNIGLDPARHLMPKPKKTGPTLTACTSLDIHMAGYSGRKVVVTGADGFIGSHVAEALVRAGADVTALALYNSFDSHGWLDDIEPQVRAAMRLVRGDVRDGASSCGCLIARTSVCIWLP